MKNKIQMIITDLDRSLLNNEHKITEYTSSVFNKCIKNGIIVVFATARPLRATKIFYDLIIPHAVICHNGAIAYVNNEQIYQCGIKPAIAKDLLEIFTENYSKINIAIESSDQMYSNFDVSRIWPEIVPQKLNIQQLPETEIEKIIIEMESVDKIVSARKHLSNELYLEICEGRLGFIMSKEATKLNAIKKLLEYFKIEIKNTIAFGDDYNDLEMINYCGIGVAMENAIEETKKSAKYICGKNDENGIAKWIEENIL
jgi:Cof subfamily protein (haloacid dehalogenase superfamily)